MKLIVTLALFSKVFSQEDEDLDERKLSHILAMTFSQVSTIYTQKNFGKLLLNYGCHCFPEASSATEIFK